MMLRETLDNELQRLDGLEAAANRARFAALGRADLKGAHLALENVKQIRRQKAALVTGDLFPGINET
jgi:hypothetical protein